jgi:hypothetical protein
VRREGRAAAACEENPSWTEAQVIGGVAGSACMAGYFFFSSLFHLLFLISFFFSSSPISLLFFSDFFFLSGLLSFHSREEGAGGLA